MLAVGLTVPRQRPPRQRRAGAAATESERQIWFASLLQRPPHHRSWIASMDTRRCLHAILMALAAVALLAAPCRGLSWPLCDEGGQVIGLP